MLKRGIFVLAVRSFGERIMERLFELAGERGHGLTPCQPQNV